MKTNIMWPVILLMLHTVALAHGFASHSIRNSASSSRRTMPSYASIPLLFESILGGSGSPVSGHFDLLLKSFPQNLVPE